MKKFLGLLLMALCLVVSSTAFASQPRARDGVIENLIYLSPRFDFSLMHLDKEVIPSAGVSLGATWRFLRSEADIGIAYSDRMGAIPITSVSLFLISRMDAANPYQFSYGVSLNSLFHISPTIGVTNQIGKYGQVEFVIGVPFYIRDGESLSRVKLGLKFGMNVKFAVPYEISK